MTDERIQPSRYPAERELIVLIRTGALMEAAPPAPPLLAHMLNADALAHPAIRDVLTRYDAALRPLFSATTLHAPQDVAAPGVGLQPISSTYHRVIADDSRLEALADD